MTPEELARVKPFFDADMAVLAAEQKARTDAFITSERTPDVINEYVTWLLCRRERVLAILNKYCPYWQHGEAVDPGDIDAHIDTTGDGRARLMVTITSFGPGVGQPNAEEKQA